MKTARIKARILPVLALAAAFAAASASAGPPPRHGGHYHGGYGSRVVIGLGVGAPYYGWGYGWGYPYGYPYYPAYGYAYPAPYVVQQQPSVYVEQAPVQQAQRPAGYWYYCADSRAYYPYVKECPAGWQRVAPRPQE